jgi:exodeoxyribonuclease X
MRNSYRIAIFDTETTGLDPKVDRVVEYAQVELTETGPVNLRSSLINPGRSIPPEAKAVHHITDEMVVEAPTLKEYLASLDMGPVTHYGAHNMEFDRSFLTGKLPFRPMLCTWRIARHICDDCPKHSNQVLRYWLGVEPAFLPEGLEAMPHRAAYDVMVTAAVLSTFIAKIGLAECLRLSDPKLPALQALCHVGKWNGQPFSSLDRGLLRWFLPRDFDIDTKYSAQYWLDHPTASS